MKVLCYGKVKPGRATCRKCKAILEYMQEDIFISAHKNEAGCCELYIRCPLCGAATEVTPKEEKP